MGDVGYAVVETADGYLVCGRTASFGTGNDIYLIKTDLNGNSPCNMYYTTTQISSPSVVPSIPILQQFRGAKIVYPATKVSKGGVSQNLCSAVFLNEDEPPGDDLIVFPNPAKNSITIKATNEEQIGFFDIFGRSLATIKTKAGEKMISDISSFPDFFFIRVQHGQIKKIIRIHD